MGFLRIHRKGFSDFTLFSIPAEMREAFSRSFDFRSIDAHVVDEHRRREDRVRLRIAVEFSTNREIENQEERLIENRSTVLLDSDVRNPVMGSVVDEELHVERIPLDREGVEVVRDSTARESMLVDERRRTGIARTVQRGACRTR